MTSLRERDRVCFAVALLAVALALGHVVGTHGDHDKLGRVQQQVRDLRAQLDATSARDRSQIAELTGDVHVLQQRERAARASRSRVVAIVPQRPAQAAQWASTVDAVRVANCESADLQHWPYSDGSRYLGDAHLRDPNGHDGKWQFAPATWRSVGGTGRAYEASEAEQDYRAWLLWKRDGWQQPWTCARLLGIT